METNGLNLDRISYFDIFEYIDKINVDSNILLHMEETNKSFNNYLKLLANYDIYAVVFFLIDSLFKELKCSNAIENHLIKPAEIKKNNVFFDTLQLSHVRIKKLQQFATKSENLSDYRNQFNSKDVRVSRMSPEGEYIFWYGVNADSVKAFMDDFVKFYKSNSLSVLDTNPFLKSALLHLIFVRIHPFKDGNGRTARLIHNIKFTDSINKLFGLNLKICPLNISQNILINKITYVNRINNIYFDLNHDNNEAINKWFTFILDMCDEQLFALKNKILESDEALDRISKMADTDEDSEFTRQIYKSKIKK